MRYLLVPLMVACPVFMGISGCPPQGDCPPPDGLMETGTWGSDGWEIDVADDGTAQIHTYCADGTSQGAVYVTDGNAAFAADMVFQLGGPSRPGTAKVYGTVCDGVFEFTYATDYGLTESASVTYGQKGIVQPCPLD